jgi:glycerophosphoryl diester phosphodiesterase
VQFAASLDVPKPANTSDGDVLVAFVYGQSSATTSVTPPSGWSLITNDNTTTPRSMYIGYKAIPSAAAETATDYNFTFGISQRACGVVFRVTGADAAHLVDVISAAASYVTGGVNAPSVTTSKDGDLILEFIWTNDSSAVSGISFADSFSSSDLGPVVTPAGNTSAIDVLFYVQASAGATSATNTITRSPAPVNGRTWTIALAADPANTSLAGTWGSSSSMGASGSGPAVGTAAMQSATALAGTGTVTIIPPTLHCSNPNDFTFVTSGITGVFTVTGQKPVNTRDNDMLLAVVYSQTAMSAGQDLSTPAGWTKIGPAQVASGGYRPVGMYVLPVPDASSLPATWDWTSPASTAGRMGVLIARITDADLTGIEDAHTVFVAGTASYTSLLFSGLTTTQANDLVLGVAHQTGTAAQSWPTWTAPAGMSQDFVGNAAPTSGTASSDGLWLGHLVQVNAGLVPNQTLTDSPAQTSVTGFAVAIKGRRAAQTPNTIGWGSASAMGSSAVSTAPSIAPTSVSSMGFSPKFVYGSAAAMASATNLGAAFLNPVQAFLRDIPMYVSHRGGDQDWVQDTAFAYAQSVAWSRKLALEVSIIPTADGYFMISDQTTTDAVFGTSGNDIRTQTKAQLKTLRTTVGNFPPMFLDEDVLPVYGGPNSTNPRVIFLDNKVANNVSAVLDMMDANGGPAWWVCKAGGTTTSWVTAAKARGYTCWGYWFPSDTAAGNLNATTAGRFDLLGLQYNDTDAMYTLAASFGKPLLSHIIYNQANATTAMSHPGVTVTGFMVAGIMEVVPADVSAAMRSVSGMGAAATIVQATNVAGWGSSTSMNPPGVIQKTGASAMSSVTHLAAAGTRIAFAHGPTMSSHTAFAAAVKYLLPETITFRSATAFLARYATVRSVQTLGMLSNTRFPNLTSKRTTHVTAAMLSSTHLAGDGLRTVKAGSRMTSVSHLAFARSIIAGTAHMTSVSSLHGTNKRATTGHLGFISTSAFAAGAGAVKGKDWLVMRSTTAFASLPALTAISKVGMFSHTSMRGAGLIDLTLRWRSVIIWDPPITVIFLESMGMRSVTQATFFASPVSSIRPFPLSARLTHERLTNPRILASLTSGRADTT